MTRDDRVGRRLEEITDTPVLVVDQDVLDRNIELLQDYCDRQRLALLPHAKTHKSIWIAERQLRAGAAGLTVAKASEADCFVTADDEQLLLAYPLVGPDKWRRAADLGTRCRLTVMLDSGEAADGLAAHARRVGVDVEILVELDAGLGRVGVPTVEDAVAVAERVERLPGLRLAGIGCYPGHLREPEELASGIPKVSALLTAAVEAFRRKGLCCDRVSAGSTKTAFRMHEIEAATESRAGTYVLGDLSDEPPSDFALTVQATVVSNPRPGRFVVDAGAKTLSADVVLAAGGRGFGLVRPGGWTIEALFDEHGVIATDEADVQPRVGDLVRIVPNHCVAVMNLHSEFLVVSDGVVVDVRPIDARGRVQ